MTPSFEQRQGLPWMVAIGIAALLSVISFPAAFVLPPKSRSPAASSGCLGRQQLRVLNEEDVDDNAALLCNGHANLCNKKANEIMYATLHNANNALFDGAWFLPNHKFDIGHALRAGYRGVNMDFGKCFDRLVLLHLSCLFKTAAPFAKVMEQILDFLNENPREVIILPTEISSTTDFLLDTPSIREIERAFDSIPGWKDKMYDHPGPGEPWPTLQELIATDKRILFFFYHPVVDCTKTIDCPVGFHSWFDYAAETRFSFPFVADLTKKASACEITRSRGQNDFFGVNAFITPPRIWGSFQIHKYDFLTNHLQACQDLNEGLQPNLVLVDHWKVGDVLQVVHDVNAGLN